VEVIRGIADDDPAEAEKRLELLHAEIDTLFDQLMDLETQLVEQYEVHSNVICLFLSTRNLFENLKSRWEK
jgi:hypothetical protein